MLIEFIGFSSSGKTTLIEKIQKQYSNEIKIVELDYNNKSYTSGWESPLFLFITDLKLLLGEARSDLKNITPLFKNIFLQKTTIFRKIALARSITRKYYLSKKYLKKDNEVIYLFDEGILQSCMNIIITSGDPAEELIMYTKRLIGSIPPDLVIYISPPVGSLVKRISARNDRKQWRDASLQTVVKSIELFDKLVKRLHNQNLLVIDSLDVDSIINAIKNHTLNKGKKC